MTELFNQHIWLGRRRKLRRHATHTEKIMWECLRKRQINNVRFFRQYSVNKFILDFYCPKLRLAIEIDGPYHFESKETIEYDNRRQKYVESLGIQFLRFKNDEVCENCDEVLKKIKEKIEEIKSSQT